MKKYTVFIFSFFLLFIVLQILSGWVLTAFYTPDFSLTNMGVSQEVMFGQTSIIPILTTLSIATLAYFLSQKLSVTSKE
ncbi:hypothetical protein BpOF4_20984 (plasmid) [Alkalihalophilus pseudofirmus OF4]|uniref:Uncharacterized protein n=1 Tax=Alkalihalophilus pseudofirmus (strain ATCC BAA-2126 / JCM 17055 / OF4) TaxID=398511 RepID=D3G1G6_ALKPO|nr:hypothetical protein [Alkalihalophilus pseudofirmus]ADC52192.1 hypothetical protein BpOF4_20984 [Alkalihalophilus pseudofirmus OF4]